MGQVSASSTVMIDAEPAAVLAAVADYQTVRPKILSEHYRDYRVLEGGQGAGTVATWKLQATKSRVREVKAAVDIAGHTVIEGRSLHSTAVYQSLIMNPDDNEAAFVLARRILDDAAQWRPLPDLTVVLTDDVTAAVAAAALGTERSTSGRLDVDPSRCVAP